MGFNLAFKGLNSIYCTGWRSYKFDMP